MTLEQRLNVFGRKLGHELGIYQRPNGRYVVTCSCGWESTGRRTLADCLGAGRHHLWLLYKQAGDSGVSPDEIKVRPGIVRGAGGTLPAARPVPGGIPS